MPASQNDQELLAWLRLARTPGLGPVSVHKLIHIYGSAQNAIDALPEHVRSRGAKMPRLPSVDSCQDEIGRHRNFEARLLCYADDEFPAFLKALRVPPAVVAVKGRTELFDRPAIAIVGARNASAAGIKMAQTLAEDLGRKGFMIVSGLARGIDRAAHLGSLSTGTIAVIAGGIDVRYPRENAALQDQIAEDGVVLSESPFGLSPRAKDFPRRNRLITALSTGVIVIEAAERSGSLISARFALEQGREVMAVPGSPLDPRSKGANRLIKQGATLVETADDVVETVEGFSGLFAESAAPDLFSLSDEPNTATLGNDLDRLRTLLSPTPVHLDVLSASMDLPENVVASLVVELELLNEAVSFPGGAVAIRVAET